MKSQFIKRGIYKCGLGLFITMSLSTCKLDEYNPASLSEENVLRDFNGFRSFQSNCYTGLWGSLIGMPYGIVSEGGTDLWTYGYGTVNQNRDIMAYDQFTINSNLVRNVWDFAYGPIKDCNKSIELAAQVKDGNPADIKILVAEAKCLRAYYYSVLVAQFGNVPLVLVDDPIKNPNPKRNTVAEIYTQIIADLTSAAQDLPVTPYQNNAQRVTKKAALGLLARAYAQGAGEGLSEGSKTYWVRAKEVADDLINNKGAYGAMMYDDFAKVFASANNRNNTEALFTAYGLNPYNASYDAFTGNTKPNLYLHYYPKFDDAFQAGIDFLKKGVNANTSNAYYGRLNQQFMAPTKYLINCFNATYDKRWENTFATAFTNYSGVQATTSLGTSAPTPAKVTYAEATITLTAAMCTKYGIDASFIGAKIYPYIDVNARNASANASWQYIPSVWPSGNLGNIGSLQTVANANVHPYPLDVNEDRFFAYLSKVPLTAADKKLRRYAVVNIDDMFDPADATGSTYKTANASNGLTPITMANLFPAMIKFNHNFDGGWLGSNFQQKLGNIMVMRMAEVYLIAAEAAMHGAGGGGVAAQYLNELRKRACRNAADFNPGTGMQLVTATMNDVFDEYARELCGEFNRWALLKRNKAFETRLAAYNRTAAVNFVPSKHYNRPIPFNFLNQIGNGDEFGNNGY